MPLFARRRLQFSISRRTILAGSVALACATSLLIAPRAHAVSSNWTNLTGGNWNTSGNWSAGVPGAVGDTANINADISASRTVTLDVSETLGTLTIGDVNNTNSYTLTASGGSVLTFNNNSSAAVLTMTSTSAGDTITVPFVLSGNLNITNSAVVSVLTLNGSSITTGSVGTKTLTTAGNGGDISISASIGGGSGDIAIAKSGNNNLILGGANTFTGGVTLSAGTLTLNNATALGGAASTLTILGGALAGNATLTNANAIKWNANFAFVGSGNLDLGAATITTAASRTLTLGGASGSTLTFTNGIVETATSTITFANAGTQTTSAVQLNGANTYSGGTVINGGSIGFGSLSAIPATGNITVNSNGALQVGGAYTTLAGWMGESRLVKTAQGALALVTDSAEGFDPGSAGFASISLGASAGKTVNYTGIYTPGVSGYLIGGGGGSLILSNANALTGNVPVTVGHGGGGTTIISNSNDNLTGVVTIDNGTLQIGNGGATGSLNGVPNIVSNSVLAFNRSDSFSFNTPVSGTGGIMKLGTNTLTIGNANSYAGATTIAGGTLTFSTAQTLTGALTFGSAAGATTGGTLNLAAASATFGKVVVQTNSSTASTITIASGRNLTVTSGFNVGYDLGTVAANVTATSKLTISGAGSLVASGSSTIFSVGIAQTSQLNTATSNTLDLTGLAGVTLGSSADPISEVRVGFGQSAAGTLLLSNTSNTITAGSLSVGHSNTLVGGVGQLTLGIGTNVIQADNINIGFSKVNGTMSFASTTLGSPGTVVIGNKAGTGGANINVGSQFATGTAAVIVGTLDLRGHNSTVNAATLTIGNNNNAGSGGSAAGIVSFDTGTFNAAAVNLGQKSGNGTGSNSTNNAINLGGTGVFNVSGATTISANTATATASVTSVLNVTGGSYTTGTFSGASKSNTGAGAATSTTTVSGGSLSVTGNSFVLASQTGSGTASGTLKITGGTVSTAADITDGGGAATTTLTLDGGTLDLGGHNIGSSASPIDALNFQTGILQNVNQINGGGVGLTKIGGAGANTLSLQGTNSYTGTTTVSAGTLFVNGILNGSDVIANASTTLGGYGQINLSTGQAVTVAGTLAPGANGYGLLTVNGGAGVTFNSAAFTLDVTQGASDRLTISGDASSNLTLNGTDTLNINAGKPGTFTIASWTGTRSGFFDLITINGSSQSYSVSTAGNITTYTFNSGVGSVAYDDGAKNIVVTVTIPEPASMLSLAIGGTALVGLARLRSRRRK